MSEPKRVELTEAEIELAESLVACECGHGLDTHNGLGCYARLSYDPLMMCLCVLTDDRTDAELLAQRLPAYVAAREAAARREALLEAADLLWPPRYVPGVDDFIGCRGREYADDYAAWLRARAEEQGAALAEPERAEEER